MCTGMELLPLLGTAASGAGALMNSRMQNQAISEQNRQNQISMERERTAREGEVGRQRDWEMSQAEATQRALAEADPTRVSEDAQRTVDEPDNRIMAAADEYNVPTLQGQVQNEDVNESIGSTIAGQTARTREMLRSAALLQAQGGQMNNVAQALFGMGSDVANIGSNRRGSMNASRLETSVPAASVTPSNSPIGDLLMIGGQIGSGIGGQRAGFGSTYRPGGPLNASSFLGPLSPR